jgi:hypothetical protein
LADPGLARIPILDAGRDGAGVHAAAAGLGLGAQPVAAAGRQGRGRTGKAFSDDIVFAYILLTAFRDFRDNFAAEIWAALGYGGEAAVFSESELPVAIIALVGMAAVIVVRDNRRALMVIHAMVAGGFALLGLSTLAFQAHLISPLAWMILAGSGLYVAYNPVNAVLFDRLVAVSGRVANAGFLIYVADSSGYMGSVALLLWRNFGQGSLNWLQFFTGGAYVTAVVGCVATLYAAAYFHYRSAPGHGAETRFAVAGRHAREGGNAG